MLKKLLIPLIISFSICAMDFQKSHMLISNYQLPKPPTKEDKKFFRSLNVFIINATDRAFIYDFNALRHIDNKGRNVLHATATKGHLAIFKKLIELYDFDINSVSQYGLTALNYAIMHDSSDIIKYIVGRPELKIDHIDKNGRTYLHYAISSKNYDLVNKILELTPQNIDIPTIEV